jgi:hypothetical protein
MGGCIGWSILFSLIVWAGYVVEPCRGASYEDTCAKLIAGNPRGLSLTLGLEDDIFFTGECIRITLEFQNTSDARYELCTRTYDRSGRMDDPQFHVEGPAQGFVDPLALYFASGAGLGGGLSNAVTLGPQGRHAQTFDLNEWVRFDLPGTYKVYCTTRRIEGMNGTRGSFPLCSPIVTFKIIRPDDAWIATRVRVASDALKSADSRERRQGARLLRFLAEPQAMVPLTSLLSDADLWGQALLGLVGARDPSRARAALRAGIRQPEIVVNDTYLRTLAIVSACPEGPVISYNPDNAEVFRQQYERLRAAQAAALQEALGELSAALPCKRGRAEATACAVLLGRGVDSPGLRERLAGVFTQLTEAEQCRVLEFRWAQVRCSSFQGPLEQILSRPGGYEQWNDAGIRSWALHRYLDVQPEKARRLILEDMRRPRPLLAAHALLSLPDESLPELDDIFVTHLAERDADYEKLPALIERYATKRVLAEVIALYEKSEGRWACVYAEHLLGYWVKHDPETGLAAVRKAAMLREHTGCFRTVLRNVLSRYYSPAAETLALSFLGDTDNDVVRDVVQLLDDLGSPAIVDPLLAHLAGMNTTDEAVSPKSMVSRSSIRREIMSCLLKKRKWQLTEAQQKTLYGLLVNDAERARFARRFPAVPREQTP